MKEVGIATFIQRYEQTYNVDIRKDRQRFVKVYNMYLDAMGWRHKELVGQRKGFGLIEDVYEYKYTKWARWNWEAYEHFVRIPNHTRTDYGGTINNDRLIKEIGKLPKNVINRIVTNAS